ncbi:MAG: hypothetical protein LBQ43_01015 [Holosporales bacterium]|nr:hypothetical protein [Holosporales bacterium]
MTKTSMLFASAISCFGGQSYASDARPSVDDAAPMDASSVVRDTIKLCGHPISELIESAKSGNTNLLSILFGILRSGIGTPEERNNALDTLLGAAYAGNTEAMRICTGFLKCIVARKFECDEGSYVKDRVSNFFIQLANEGKKEALSALTTSDYVGVIRNPEVQASFTKLILDLIGREIPVMTPNSFDFIAWLAPETQLSVMRSLVKLAKEGNSTALRTLYYAISYHSHVSRDCFPAFLQRLIDNNCPAALNFNIEYNMRMISADEWLNRFDSNGQALLCNIEYLTKSASPEQIEKILLDYSSHSDELAPGMLQNVLWTHEFDEFASEMLETEPEKVVSALEKLANAGNVNAMVALGRFLIEKPATTREAVKLFLKAVKLREERIIQRISDVRHANGYDGRVQLIKEILLEQASAGDYQIEANILLGYLIPSKHGGDMLSSLLKADELGKDISRYVGLRCGRGRTMPEVQSYLERKAEAGSLDAKFFLGLSMKGLDNPPTFNKAASLVMEVLINSHTDYSDYLGAFRAVGADTSPELAVLCGMNSLFSSRSESHGCLKIVDFSEIFSEE